MPSKDKQPGPGKVLLQVVLRDRLSQQLTEAAERAGVSRAEYTRTALAFKISQDLLQQQVIRQVVDVITTKAITDELLSNGGQDD